MKQELCKLCMKEINLKIEQYVVMEDYEKMKLLKKAFFHRSCFNQRMERTSNEALKLMMQNIPAITDAVKKQLVMPNA